MKFNDLIRIAVVIGGLGLLFGGDTGGGSSPSTPYTGSMTAVHASAEKMEKNDRQGLSEALTAASKMLEDDKAKLIKTTEDIQNFTRGSMAYGYSSFALAKYPEVSKAVQVELEKAVGDEITAVTPEIKNRTVATLKELGQAIK
jgi:septal ring factor EnvC (AmiA/AmiB activator)